jgi:hypothetical protein
VAVEAERSLRVESLQKGEDRVFSVAAVMGTFKIMDQSSFRKGMRVGEVERRGGER